MSIDFNSDRWERVKEVNKKWWSGQLDRPLIQVSIANRDPGQPEPAAPYHSFTAYYGEDISAEQIIDRWEYDLSKLTFYGDAFPCVFPNFGPGVLATFLGCRPELGSNTVWFHPNKDLEISDIHLVEDDRYGWFERIMSINKAAIDRWQGSVQIGMTDLGGNLDVVASFRPGEKLLLDLFDHPDEVHRVTWEAHDLWWKYFNLFNEVLLPTNPGYSAWAPIYSPESYYMLQCDFCYMISPQMFDEFVKPELQASCKKLKNAFYHLDGPGQLPHLDSLLSIEELKGVQWIPGEGQPPFDQWPDVYRKIRKAGKLIQLYGSPETLDNLVKQLGSGEGLLFQCWGVDSEEQAIDLVKRYGADE